MCSGCVPDPQNSPTAAQLEVLNSLHASAQRELFAKGGNAGVSGNTALLDVDELALPPDGFLPVPLGELEKKCGRKLVERLTQATVSDHVAKENKMKSGVKRIYSDPALRCPRIYLKLVRRLMQVGLVRFQTKKPKCRVGLFAVNKKNNEQRLVLGARYSSCYFTDPKGTARLWRGIRINRGGPRTTSMVGQRRHPSGLLRHGAAGLAPHLLRAPTRRVRRRRGHH